MSTIEERNLELRIAEAAKRRAWQDEMDEDKRGRHAKAKSDRIGCARVGGKGWGEPMGGATKGRTAGGSFMRIQFQGGDA